MSAITAEQSAYYWVSSAFSQKVGCCWLILQTKKYLQKTHQVATSPANKFFLEGKPWTTVRMHLNFAIHWILNSTTYAEKYDYETAA